MAESKDWNVNSQSAAFEDLAGALQLPRALYAGTRMMRWHAANGATFLPKARAESSEAYSDRVEKTVLYNGFKRTVDSLVGRPFGKIVQWGEKVPDPIQEWGKNIDLDGRDITVFSRDSFRDGWIGGAGYILTEAPLPPVDGSGRTVKQNLLQEIRSNVRPWLVHVPADRVIFVRSQIVNGVRMATQVRIRESHSVEAGPWGEECIERVRVLYPGRWELYQASGDTREDWDNPTLVGAGVSSLPYIPIFPFYTMQTGFMQSLPALGDLAELNGRHWQASSDLAHILHVTNFPVLFLKGGLMGDEPEEGDPNGGSSNDVEHGPNVMYNGKPDSDMKFVEPQGSAIAKLFEYISTLEEQMATMGMEPLLPRRQGAETAYGRALDSKEAFCALGVTVLSYKNAVESALMAGAEMMKLPVKRDEIQVEINMEFGITPHEAQDLDALKFARENRDISREAYLFELKRREVLHDGYDAEDDYEIIEKETADQDLGDLPGALPAGKPARPVLLPGGKAPAKKAAAPAGGY